MNKEIKLSKNTMIVSETNSKGHIIYANSDFCKISGFTKEELIGKPHSMVRHEDMPRAAFKDLWKTVQKGKTWKGIVKNLCKNGDYYWVNATAYPVEKSNGKHRFISVRIKPTSKEIENAQKMYKKLLKEEK
ncbi:MAG: PAS domain-containing protein [Campylobacteraceae bacterium]|nr:PAS domain-containing protein [Campylobacteraceae bacterium]